MKRVLCVVVATVALGCAPVQMFVPMGTAQFNPKPAGQVEFFDKEPTRNFQVIGLIVPPEDEYDSYAEMIAAARREAGKNGADAIFIASETDRSGWSFDVGRFGGGGGSNVTTSVRLKAIVWK